MARFGNWNRFPRYVPVAERRFNADKARKALEKKGHRLNPAILHTPLRSWWASSWCKNLERYADYSNRIGRGRSYARNGSVVDLNLEAGKILALVQGSQARPYKIEIKLTIFRADKRRELASLCEGKLESAKALLSGTFPKELEPLLFGKEQGLFPDPRQITFTCSCPDSANMCKHVAASLYAVGARLDEDPLLFFTLRGIQVEELVGHIVEKSTESLLKKKRGSKNESKVLDTDDSGLGKLFGLNFSAKKKTPPRPKN